jgi:hypothetical protein
MSRSTSTSRCRIAATQNRANFFRTADVLQSEEEDNG